MKLEIRKLGCAITVWFTALLNVMAESNSSDFIQKDVCPNSCRLLMSYSDYAHCTCHPTDGNGPCLYGCQTIKCLCPGIPGKTCQVWCGGFSSDHGMIGCDCSRTWDLEPIPPSTTISPTTRPTTVFSGRTWRVKPSYTVYTSPPHGTHGGPGTSPVAIGSIVATLVVVLVVVAFLVAYVQRRLICQKRQPSSAIHRSRGTTISLALIEPVRAHRNGTEPGYPVVSRQNDRFFLPAPTPSLPPSYEDSMRQATGSSNPGTRAPDYVESPPPYTSIGEGDAPTRGVNESAV